MKNFRRKQFILPQSKLDQVKRVLGARTETEAIILSLEAVLRQKKLEAFIDLPKKLHFSLTHGQLEKLRRD